MELVAFARGSTSDWLPLILPQIAAASGRVNLDVRITGTPKHPYASGSLVVRDGAVRPANREEVLTAVTGTVALDGERAARRVVRGAPGQARAHRGEARRGRRT